MAASVATRGFFKPRLSTKRHAGVEPRDVLAFFRQMNTLFRTGTPLYQGLLIAADQTESTGLAKVIRGLAEHIASGGSLAEAMAGHPRVFRPEWCESVRSGEISGQLDVVLVRLCEQIETQLAFRSKIIGSLFYPAMILVVSTAAVVVMLTMVVPTFTSMFAEFGKELPGPTKVLVALSDDLRNDWLSYLAPIAVGAVVFRSWVRTPRGRRIWSDFLLSVPLIGDLMVQSAMQRFSQNLSNLLASGVPILEALSTVQRIFRRTPSYHDAVGEAVQSIDRGGNLTDALSRTGLFTPFLTNMIRIGEESGTLPETLSEVGRFYQGKVETTITRLAAQVETVLIILMSVVVAGVLIALYLPMFELSSSV